MSKLKDMLVVTDTDIDEVRKYYQKSETDMREVVAILKEWLRQQPHLPDDEDEGRLERMYLKNKCRLEQTKQKLERCYSFKVFYPETLYMYDLNSAGMQNATESILCVPLPNLTEKQERIVVTKVTNGDSFQGLNAFMYMLTMMEFGITYDYSLSEILVMDWDGCTLNAMKTITPKVLHIFSTICMKALSARYSSIQVTNAPVYIDVFIRMAKATMTPKLFSKIRCTSSIEDIYDVIPKELLPIEYGGKEKSMYKLHDEWMQELPYHADVFTKISKRISNEKLRIGKLDENDLFGTEGTFKKINLD